MAKKTKEQKALEKQARIPFLKVIRKHWLLLLMLVPAIAYVVIFSYIPMTGIVMAFKRFTAKGGIYGSPWVGLKNFKSLIISNKLWMITRNTLLYNVAFIFLDEDDNRPRIPAWAIKVVLTEDDIVLDATVDSQCR